MLTKDISDIFKDFGEEFLKNIEEEMNDLRDEMQDISEQEVPVLSGNLKNSIKYETAEDMNGNVSVKLNGGLLEEYWSVIEYGNSTHRPQPFIAPAVEHGEEKILEKIQNAFRKS